VKAAIEKCETAIHKLKAELDHLKAQSKVGLGLYLKCFMCDVTVGVFNQVFNENPGY